nr:uncharacterized protein LOC113722453 isoform X4 [Coffea arabica]
MPIFYFLSSSLISLFTSSSFQSSSNFSHLLPLFFFWFFFLVFNSDQEQQQKEITVLQVSSGLKRVKVSSEHDKFHETYVLDRDVLLQNCNVSIKPCNPIHYKIHVNLQSASNCI